MQHWTEMDNDKKTQRVCMDFKEQLPILSCDDLCNLPEYLATGIRIKKENLFFTVLHISLSQSSNEFDKFFANFNCFYITLMIQILFIQPYW